MKKIIKVLIAIVIISIALLSVDFICIHTLNKPIFALKENNVYKGLFYDTYICQEYSVPQIKAKNTKFSCANTNTKIIESIVDTSIGTDLGFPTALEEIYEDDEYTYYLGYIKSSVIIVTYTNGEKENIKEALSKGNIKIKDLDEHNISYIKEQKNM